MRPYDADTEEKVRAQKQDNFSVSDYWILADDKTVSIGHAEGAQGAYTVIPRAVFVQLVDWYMADQAKK